MNKILIPLIVAALLFVFIPNGIPAEAVKADIPAENREAIIKIAGAVKSNRQVVIENRDFIIDCQKNINTSVGDINGLKERLEKTAELLLQLIKANVQMKKELAALRAQNNRLMEF